MQITLTTPALLFPAISLLLLAYSGRFLALASLVRELHSRYKASPDIMIKGQIINLKRRLKIIVTMQAFGVLGFFLCVLSMFTLFTGLIIYGELLFALSLVFLMVSLALSFWEIRISAGALQLQLSDIEQEGKN